MGKFWTDEKVAHLLAHPDGFPAFNDRYGPLDYEMWRSKKRRLLETPETLTPMAGGALVEVTLPATDAAWWDHLYKKEDAAGNAIALQTQRTFTNWFAPGDGLPVGLVFTGDWHLGAGGVKTRLLDAALDRARQTPGVYLVGMGDYVEGATLDVKAAPGVYTAAYANFDEQEKSLHLRTGRAGKKWIVLLKGNHDEMYTRRGGPTHVDKLASALGCAYFGEGGGTIYAHVGGQRYVIAARHSPTGGVNALRLMGEKWPAWERLHVAVVAHLHFNEMLRISRNRGRAFGLRCGTFKVWDEYAEASGFTPELGTPMVILYPDEERVEAFAGDDIERGYQVLAWERDRYLHNYLTGYNSSATVHNSSVAQQNMGSSD